VDLSLWWVLPARDEVALGRSVLQALSVTPEARPRLFGTYEPLRDKLPPDDDEPFLAAWRDEAKRDVPGGRQLIWKGSTPFRLGTASFPYKEVGQELEERERIVTLSIWVRPSGYAEPERRDRLVDFFVEIANKLEAIYASAGLDGQAQPEVGIDALSDTVVVRGAWIGLPPVRTWLHWFGGPYVSELSELPSIAKSGNGLVLRRGEELGTSGSLPGPPMPAHFCWQEETTWEFNGRARFPVTTRMPAEVIPVIGASPARGQAQHEVAAVEQSRLTKSAATSHRLVWKDKDGPGWPGGGHPQREGQAWIRAADGSLEELDDGAWMTRAEAQERANREGLAFEEV
jgi:hypothetical protein